MVETYPSKAVDEPATRSRLGAGPVRAAAVVLAGVLAFAVLDRSGAVALALDGPRSIPTLLGGTLLVGAGGLAWLLGGEQPAASAGRAQWRVGAVAFLLLGIERTTSLHDWVRQWEDASFAVVFGPLLAVVVVAWAVLLTRLADRPASFALFASGATLWLTSQLPEALDRPALEAVGAAGELAGSGLIAAGLLFAVPAKRVPWDAGDRIRDWLGPLAEQAVRAADVRRIVVATAGMIAIFAALGGLVFATGLVHDVTEATVDRADHPLQWFDPNRELTFNTYFSALIPAAAAALALLLARLRVGDASTVWVGLALVLAAIGAEELINVHGKFQDVTGVQALVGFAPAVLAAAVVSVLAIHRLRAHRPAPAVFVGGAFAWAVALGVDVLIGRDSPVGILEDGLEMVGSAMFAIALLLAARQELDARRAGARPRPTGA